MATSGKKAEVVTELSFPQALAVGAGGRLLDSLMRSTSLREEGGEHYRPLWAEGKAIVFVLWHGRLLPPTFQHRGRGVATLISQHRDGEYITRVVRDRWGYVVVRGSSSRGGVQAVAEMIRLVKQGRSLAVTPDGPRGPREKMKLGPLLVAQRTGAPVVPVG